MSPQTDRTWSDGAGTASLPATGTRPGAHAGRGYGEGLGKTERNDLWWVQPVAQALGLVLLIGYANYAAILGAAHYHYVDQGRHYLSPFYSPYLHPGWLPAWLSPALLILVFPLGFRTTCYYYRKAYYRAFFADPMGCAVGEARSKGYCGELKFPFVLQNIHRYFLYAALVILVILWWDVIQAFTFRDATGRASFGVGGGSLAILASTVLLTLYTFSCHSLRHIVGGKLDCFSCVAAGGPRLKAWRGVSALNGHHMGFAWWSLGAVCFADLYVRLCSMGVIRDPMLLTLAAFDMPLKPFGP